MFFWKGTSYIMLLKERNLFCEYAIMSHVILLHQEQGKMFKLNIFKFFYLNDIKATMKSMQ